MLQVLRRSLLEPHSPVSPWETPNPAQRGFPSLPWQRGRCCLTQAD